VGSLLDPNMLFVIAALLLVVLVVTAIVRAVQIIPQATAAVVERLGRFKAVEEPGLVFLVPFVDKIRARIDLREQVRSFPPQPVITKDNLTVNIDTVVYYQVTEPQGGGLRDRRLHQRRRADHHDHPAQRRRRPEPRGDAHGARRDQLPAAR
jgi:regulator of protease activity HflC (stomatin/prohibitin superfamily)